MTVEQMCRTSRTAPRLFSLFREVYCDRLAAHVVGDDIDVVVSMLVKIATGLDEVDPASYRKQAAEVLASEPAGSLREQPTPNSTSGRKLSSCGVRLQSETECTVRDLIQGAPPLTRSTVAQQVLAQQTRCLIDEFFTRSWARDLLLSRKAIL